MNREKKMLLDPRAMWTRDDVAEYLRVDIKTVDRIVVRELPPTTYVGRLPRWNAGVVMDAANSGMFDVKNRGAVAGKHQRAL